MPRPTTKGVKDTKAGMIAHEPFKSELEPLTEDDMDLTYGVYLEFGLHTCPGKLKAVRELVDGLSAVKSPAIRSISEVV